MAMSYTELRESINPGPSHSRAGQVRWRCTLPLREAIVQFTRECQPDATVARAGSRWEKYWIDPFDNIFQGQQENNTPIPFPVDTSTNRYLGGNGDIEYDTTSTPTAPATAASSPSTP